MTPHEATNGHAHYLRELIIYSLPIPYESKRSHSIVQVYLYQLVFVSYSNIRLYRVESYMPSNMVYPDFVKCF